MSTEVKKSVEDISISLEEALEDVEIIEVSEEHRLIGRNHPKHDPIIRARARELYMANHSYVQIEAATKVPRGTIMTWASREGWSAARKQNQDDSLKDDLQSKKYLLSQLSLEILENCLKGVRKAGGPDGFKPKDLATFLSTLGNVEKLSRLSLGLATSISEERSKRANFTLPLEHLKSVQQVKVSDPFALTESKDTNDSAHSAESNGTKSDT